MIKIENTVVMNIDNALRGMRNPMDSWDKSDSGFQDDRSYTVGPNDITLAYNLRMAGPAHRKYLRQIFVSVDITAPLYWWKEFDTYKVGTVRNSCSTMHKLGSHPITIDDFSTDRMTEQALKETERFIDHIEIMRVNWKHEEDEIKKKEFWYSMIQMLPSSFNQKATVTMNYENLVNMYHDRKNHKQDEWRITFCNWIKELPFSDEFITGELKPINTDENEPIQAVEDLEPNNISPEPLESSEHGDTEFVECEGWADESGLSPAT